MDDQTFSSCRTKVFLKLTYRNEEHGHGRWSKHNNHIGMGTRELFSEVIFDRYSNSAAHEM